MMAVLKKLIVIILIFISGLIIFMNVTPGFFQEVPCCSVGYITAERASKLGLVSICDICEHRNILGWSLIKLSYLDFYR
jgi:hypothetical protein